MNIKGQIIGSIIITALFVWIAVAGGKWAMKVSKQTEKNFADAVRVMQGEDIGR